MYIYKIQLSSNFKSTTFFSIANFSIRFICNIHIKYNSLPFFFDLQLIGRISINSFQLTFWQNRNGYHRIIHDYVQWPYFFQVLQEMDLSGTGSIAPQEFIHVLSKMPDFAYTFQLKIH